MKNRQDTRRKIENQFDQDDTYGVLTHEMEVDTDVNEDPIRERLLDDSLDSFLHSKK